MKRQQPCFPIHSQSTTQTGNRARRSRLQRGWLRSHRGGTWHSRLQSIPLQQRVCHSRCRRSLARSRLGRSSRRCYQLCRTRPNQQRNRCESRKYQCSLLKWEWTCLWRNHHGWQRSSGLEGIDIVKWRDGTRTGWNSLLALRMFQSNYLHHLMHRCTPSSQILQTWAWNCTLGGLRWAWTTNLRLDTQL